ncbi:MAG: pyridoxal phosphate-dependent aminotransferase [Candidatus Thorarchaeota archaeon]|jgi:aspartate/methionine/tyrosine aminotransferase
MDLGYCSKLDKLVQNAKQNPHLIDISMCDPPRFGFRPDPTFIRDFSQEELAFGYPSAKEDLVKGIVTRTRDFTGHQAAESDVIISSGLGGAFASLAIALSGKSVGTHTPFYSPVYEYFRKTTELWFFRCTPELDWGVDLDNLRNELEKRNTPGYLIVISPSNPTGHVLSKREMAEVINLAGEYNQILISDEVYDEMCFVPFTSALGNSKDVPVVYMHGFSKVWRAPEIRLGYMILHDPEEKASSEFSEIRRVCTLGFGVSPYSQMMGTQLLKERVEYRQEQFKGLKARRDALNDAIKKSSNLSSVEARGATYQFIKTPWNDWDVCQYMVEKHNMLVTPASVFDPYIGHDYVRIVFLNEPAILQKFVTLLDEGIS